MFKAQHTIITPVVGYNFKTELTVHNFNFQSQGSPPCWAAYCGVQANTQHILHILPGTHLYTWVESSNVDRVSCWRTKVPGIDGKQTRNPLIQSQGFTPIYHGTSTMWVSLQCDNQRLWNIICNFLTSQGFGHVPNFCCCIICIDHWKTQNYHNKKHPWGYCYQNVHASQGKFTHSIASLSETSIGMSWPSQKMACRSNEITQHRQKLYETIDVIRRARSHNVKYYKEDNCRKKYKKAKNHWNCCWGILRNTGNNVLRVALYLRFQGNSSYWRKVLLPCCRGDMTHLQCLDELLIERGNDLCTRGS